MRIRMNLESFYIEMCIQRFFYCFQINFFKFIVVFSRITLMFRFFISQKFSMSLSYLITYPSKFTTTFTVYHNTSLILFYWYITFRTGYTIISNPLQIFIIWFVIVIRKQTYILFFVFIIPICYKFLPLFKKKTA